jgi:hypothetical protein
MVVADMREVELSSSLRKGIPSIVSGGESTRLHFVQGEESQVGNQSVTHGEAVGSACAEERWSV